MPSSNNAERKDWLLFLVSLISAVGISLTGVVLNEILHLESRLAVIEWKVGLRGPSLGLLKEPSNVRTSLASPLPFNAHPSPHKKKALGK